MKRLQSTTILLATCLLVHACAPSGTQSESELASQKTLGRDAWLEKVSKKLRDGRPLSRSDDLARLRGLDKIEVVELFMNDPGFGDTMLSFNLFFLGRGVDRVRTRDGSLHPDVMESPQALAAASAVSGGQGDFSLLFQRHLPLLSGPQRDPSFGSRTATPGGIDIPENQRTRVPKDLRKRLRAKHRQAIVRKTSELLETQSEGLSSRQRPLNCLDVNSFEQYTISKLRQAGFSETIVDAIRSRWLGLTTPQAPCVLLYSEIEVRSRIVDLQRELDGLFEMIEELPHQTGKAVAIRDLVYLSGKSSRLTISQDALTPLGFWQRVPNSTTNFNRARAAYIFKTYFCDDLTPIDVVLAEEGEAGHATEAACQSCHYKLDPLAGLFRNHGRMGESFFQREVHVFDDGVTITGDELAMYRQTWQDGSGQWKVGFYINPGEPHPQWEGNRLDDLFSFLSRSNEVGRCVVRRMAEFFLGADQVYDGSWLSEIGEPVMEGDYSPEAVRSVVRELMLSKTFVHPDPEPGVCYDFGSSGEATSGLPCEVRHIVEEHCESCHDAAPLDLTRWGDVGERGGFRHLDSEGKPRSKNDSLRMLIERVQTSDRERRMPIGGYLPDAQRKVLLDWLTNQIGETRS